MKIYLKLVSVLLILVLVFMGVGVFGVSAEGTYIKPEKFIYGDVDMDSVVTVKDATLVQKGVAGITYVTAVQKYLADPAGEGFNVKNATAIQKYLAGHETESMIGEELDMSSQDEFSSKNKFYEGDTRDYMIEVYVKNTEWDYTLEDFPEYDFNKIIVNHVEYGTILDIKVCYLYLSNHSKENVEDAIRALDYRANLDLRYVYMSYIYTPA